MTDVTEEGDDKGKAKEEQLGRLRSSNLSKVISEEIVAQNDVSFEDNASEGDVADVTNEGGHEPKVKEKQLRRPSRQTDLANVISNHEDFF
eukprot:CAMPEP_0172487154 /NCGR_PEP_ID=MMETSP1066-20121228/16095_1 /TAXON_ID=671091 /ORGANISM="Coscinodiscus wailesii, Strain CCMP2513" /LENGTH=90 /DNA_ID=CAMNT_0013253579 /DNA_START=1 /DNA_END=270 /DNA_ORIENTATION=+